YELIFVNDRSSDNSESILKKMIQETEIPGEIKLISMSRNFGVGACVQAGMNFSKGDVLIYMDSDLQDPPEVIPRMIDAYLEDDVEIVHTVRERRAGEGKIKLLITAIGYRLLKLVSTIDLQIEAGDFKLLSRRAVTHLLELKEINPYTRGLVAWIGFKQVSITYGREARFSGSTKFPIFSSKVILNFFTSALIAFSDLPLQIASLAGLGISLFSIVGGVIFLILLLAGNSINPIWLLFVWGTLLFGVTLLCIGMLGIYVAAIHKASRNRPAYIVDNTSGFPEK
ncbi:MAG: glycosyltransferase family 2 protein, partial [Chthoniobacterales bacterium]